MDSKIGHSNQVSIRELLNLSDLSEVELLGLLESGSIPFCKGENNELLLDISEVDPATLVPTPRASLATMSDEQRAELEEIVGSEIIAALDGIVVDAIELATNWLSTAKQTNEEDR